LVKEWTASDSVCKANANVGIVALSAGRWIRAKGDSQANEIKQEEEMINSIKMKKKKKSFSSASQRGRQDLQSLMTLNT
jgi:hypothetical protein